MKNLLNPLILVKEANESIDDIILSFLIEYLGENRDVQKELFERFWEYIEEEINLFYNKIENKFILDFFNIYMIVYSNEDKKIKEKLKTLENFDNLILTKEQQTEVFSKVINYILENKIKVNYKFLSFLNNKTINNKVQDYIEINDELILDFINLDKEPEKRKEKYKQEFTSRIKLHNIKEPENEGYNILTEILSKKEKEEIILIYIETKENIGEVIKPVIIDKIIINLNIISKIEIEEEVKTIIEKEIKKLKEERANLISSGKVGENMDKISEKKEIPKELIELTKDMMHSEINIINMGLIPDYKNIIKYSILDFFTFATINDDIGLTKINIKENDSKKYFESLSENKITLKSLYKYELCVINALKVFLVSCSKNNLLEELRTKITIFINEVSNLKLEEKFLFSLAGSLFLINLIEKKIKIIHYNLFGEYNTNFIMLKKLFEENYITENEFFFIMYIVFDENGLNLRNDLSHGNIKFNKNEFYCTYLLFLLFIIIDSSIYRKEKNV